MKLAQLSSTVRLRHCLALLAISFAAGVGATHAALPTVQPLVQPGKWPAWRPGSAYDVKVVGHYAYVALVPGGLGVFDVSNPANCVPVGSYDSSEFAFGVAVSGNYAYLANGAAGLQVIDVSNPTNCVRVGGYDTSGYAKGVAVAGNYAYVADNEGGLQVIDVSNPTT